MKGRIIMNEISLKIAEAFKEAEKIYDDELNTEDFEDCMKDACRKLNVPEELFEIMYLASFSPEKVEDWVEKILNPTPANEHVEEGRSGLSFEDELAKDE